MCRGAQQEASQGSSGAGGDPLRNREALAELEALHTQQKQQVEEMRKDLVEGLQGLGLASA